MEPQWQPISMLPVLSQLIDSVYDASQEQRRDIRRAADKPHVLDNMTLLRILEQYGQQRNHLNLYEDQLSRWKHCDLSIKQSQEIDRLLKQLPSLKQNIEDILKIARSLSGKTIDVIAAMDDLDLAEAILTGKINAPLS